MHFIECTKFAVVSVWCQSICALFHAQTLWLCNRSTLLEYH